MSSPPPDQRSCTFHAPAERVRWFSEVICGLLPANTATVRVLDIGCGSGDQLFDLAPRLPRAELVGVDIVRSNVVVARERAATDPSGARLTFTASDYLAFEPAAPFDLLMSYSVLQFVPGDVDDIAARIARHSVPGGCFANVMPYRCGYNRLLAAVRWLLGAVRSPALDRLILGAARALHRDVMDEAMLTERLVYAYAVPVRFEEELAAALARRGFRTERREPIHHASPGQMKHALRIMRAPA
jgi:SAM-dependent methyltransferase